MAYSGSQLTRLGLYGGTRGLYGSFAGKVENENSAGPHNPGEITRLGLAAIPRGLYGSFAGKVEAAPEPEPEPEVEETPAAGGGAEPQRRAPFTGRGFFTDDEPLPGEVKPEPAPLQRADSAPIDSLLPRDQSAIQARLDAARERARRAEERAIRQADNERLANYLEAERERLDAAIAASIEADDEEVLLLDYAIRMDAVGLVIKKILKR